MPAVEVGADRQGSAAFPAKDGVLAEVGRTPGLCVVVAVFVVTPAAGVPIAAAGEAEGHDVVGAGPVLAARRVVHAGSLYDDVHEAC